MGEISEMMLEGLLDEETGEYIGDRNLQRYGTECPGFPVSYEREHREGRDEVKFKKTAKVECPLCKKRVKSVGLSDHMRDVHGR